MSEITLRENGVAKPFDTIETDFPSRAFLQGYLSIYHCANKLFRNSDIGLDLKDYANGTTLFGFDLTPDQNEGSHFGLLREGKLSLDVKLSESLKESVTLVCYLVYDSVLEMDKDRNVYYSGGAD